MDLSRILESDKTVRAIGIDDQPFERDADAEVGIAGVVCKETRFDGMVWTRVGVDGRDGNERIRGALVDSKFLPQLHALLIDGIALAGFNVVDLPALADALEIPCIAVMRRRPDFDAIRRALRNVDAPDQRLETMERAGDVHEAAEAYFQVAGCEPAIARRAVERLTVTGHIPEPIRIAHLVATAVADGESGRRA